jgi:hypothetical protein
MSSFRAVDVLSCETVEVVRVVDQWPRLTCELLQALRAEGEVALAAGVGALTIVELCGCEDDFCQSFYTAPKPAGAYGPGHRNVLLQPPWSGELILDVVHHEIVFVEVLYRYPLD